MTDLFVGPPVQVSDGTPFGYPFDYAATDVIESGDSGGPVETTDGTIVVAVNSGGGGGDVEVLARVDLVYGWIQQQVAANGGGGNDAGITPDYAATEDAGAGYGYGYGVESDDAGNGSGATPNGSSPSGAGSYGCSAASGSSSSSSFPVAWLVALAGVITVVLRRRRPS
jgi:MYXO-CTERM domain-containing protein